VKRLMYLQIPSPHDALSVAATAATDVPRAGRVA